MIIMQEGASRLIVVSNRLPVVLTEGEDGNWGVKSGAGGLVTALAPVLRDRGGLWIGWPGTTKPVPNLEAILDEATSQAGYALRPVLLTEEDLHLFYNGYANQIIWPLFHDLPSLCNYEPAFFQAGARVNDRFAEAIVTCCAPDDFVWIHDYHLMLAAHSLREQGFGGHLAFFLHIPFPALDIFLKLPHRAALLRALLQYDLIGFQTQRDRRNFIQCVRTLFKDVAVRSQGYLHLLRAGGREVRVGAFPIGIDFNEFARHAESIEVAERAWLIHEDMPERQVILGVDRLDYSKGIPQRLKAFRNALHRHGDLHGRVVFMQIVVPSRADIAQYASMKEEIERLVSEINGEFTQSGWVPVHYIYRSLERTELLAYYRTSDIALITPLKDGMNLVCKEYCASNIDQRGVLILSEFAGAAAQLSRGALLVNPNDIEEVADAIHRAFTMPPEERRARMRRLRRSVRVENIFTWVESFVRAAFARDLAAFPVLDNYFAAREEEPGPPMGMGI